MKKKTFELYSKLIDKLDEFEDQKGVRAINMTKVRFYGVFNLFKFIQPKCIIHL